MIIKTQSWINGSSSIFKNSFSECDSETREKYWLSVSSFSLEYLVLDDSSFKSFVPCVGMALGLKKEDGYYSLLNTEDFNGTIFCFLPLSIENTFKYNLNCSFALTEDRLRIFEKSKDDRGIFYKHLWNEYLIPPILANLYTMIEYAKNNVKLENSFCIFNAFFPIDNSSYFFKKYQTDFYRNICTDESTLRIFPRKVKGHVKFYAYKDCVFLDFEFDEPNLQNIGLNFINNLSFDEVIIINILKFFLSMRS